MGNIYRSIDLRDSGKITEIKRDANACIFISHRQADSKSAEAIAQYILLNTDNNVYIDTMDYDLNNPGKQKDPKDVVTAIDSALAFSTHLLGVISDNTRGSWWVPYEFGGTRLQNKPTAFTLLSGVEELPEYMQVSQLIKDVHELNHWVKQLPNNNIRKSYSYQDVIVPNLPRVRYDNPKFFR